MMSKKNFKLIGGLLIAGLLAAFLSTQAFGAAVTISISGITKHDSGNVPANALVQVIQSDDAAIGAPGTDGKPAGDTVVVTGKINPDGTFQSGASIASNKHVSIRVWESWNGTGTPTGYYGTGPAENVGAGFVYTYDPSGFACSTLYGQVVIIEPSISGISPSTAAIGQTIVISGANFGASKGGSTVTIGGKSANPTAWSASSITLAVPSGVAGGSADVSVTVSGKSATASITADASLVYIDDIEGGSVGTWTTGLADSGYYVFDKYDATNPNPKDTTSYPDRDFDTATVQAGARAMKLLYSWGNRSNDPHYAGADKDWGGGWGAKLANILDLSSLNKINFYVKWDGSSNEIKLSLKDTDGTAYAASVSNAALTGLSGYGLITLNKSAFVLDAGSSDSRANTAFDWAKVASYNFVYPTQGTSNNYHYLDSIIAGEVGGGGGEIPTGEVVIANINPAAGPAGTKFTGTGAGFGGAQGQSILVFENQATNISYPVEVLSWNDATIEAIVPKLAPIGNYTLKVIKLAISAGNMQVFESNSKTFKVTATMSAAGIATVYPNPFNPLATQLAANGMKANQTTIAYSAAGIEKVGIYIYDTTARLVYHAVSSGNQVSWDGKDSQGNYAADGVYLLRVVNEETKGLISKGKILVIKR